MKTKYECFPNTYLVPQTKNYGNKNVLKLVS